jgi:hypothetical protein
VHLSRLRNLVRIAALGDAITCSTTCRQRLRRGRDLTYLPGLSKRLQRKHRAHHDAMDAARAAAHRGRASISLAKPRRSPESSPTPIYGKTRISPNAVGRSCTRLGGVPLWGKGPPDPPKPPPDPSNGGIDQGMARIDHANLGLQSSFAIVNCGCGIAPSLNWLVTADVPAARRGTAIITLTTLAAAVH